MTIDINIDNYPEVKAKIEKALKAKVEKRKEKFDKSKITYGAEFGIIIGAGPNKPTQASVIGSYGRLSSSVYPVDVQEVDDYFAEFDEADKKEEELKEKRENFFDKVMTGVGKKGNYDDGIQSPGVMNGYDFINFIQQKPKPLVFPKLSDVKTVSPEVYNEYLKKADGTTLIEFCPKHGKCDEFGFREFKILAAYRKTKSPNKVTFVCEDDRDGFSVVGLNNFEIHDNDTNRIVWIFNCLTLEYERAIAAKPGDFKGYRNTKCTKLTNKEISDLVKDKIFGDGGADITRQMTPGVNNLGGGLFGIGF